MKLRQMRLQTEPSPRHHKQSYENPLQIEFTQFAKQKSARPKSSNLRKRQMRNDKTYTSFQQLPQVQ